MPDLPISNLIENPAAGRTGARRRLSATTQGPTSRKTSARCAAGRRANAASPSVISGTLQRSSPSALRSAWRHFSESQIVLPPTGVRSLCRTLLVRRCAESPKHRMNHPGSQFTRRHFSRYAAAASVLAGFERLAPTYARAGEKVRKAGGPIDLTIDRLSLDIADGAPRPSGSMARCRGRSCVCARARTRSSA